jgi:pimeloyl-ACP methyl ester carboxylesterase
VVRPDYSGSGATVDDGKPLSVAILAAQVVEAAKAAGAARFDLVGFSLGASIAAYIAAEYPDQVRSVVMIAGFACGNDSRLKLEFELWRDLIRSDRKALARLVLLTGFSPDFLGSLSTQQIDENVEAILADTQWEGMDRQIELDLTLDVTDQIKRITQPSLVIGCKHDYMVSPAHARALAAAIPGARYADLNSGHLAPLEQPDELARLVTDFLTVSSI